MIKPDEHSSDETRSSSNAASIAYLTSNSANGNGRDPNAQDMHVWSDPSPSYRARQVIPRTK